MILTKLQCIVRYRGTVPEIFFLLCSSDNGHNSDVRSGLKFVVFLNHLLPLFHICPCCKTGGVLVDWKQIGTMLEVKCSCPNQQCTERERMWRSQPNMPGTDIPAGNILLSFAILLSGSSAAKVLTVFNHMGLSCISQSTYYKHQKV